MSDDIKNSFSNHIGGWMTFIAWVAFIGFLGYSFNLLIQKQNNPNQSISTAFVDGSKQITLTRNKHGHYVANGEINGHPVIFLLDTGATDVALSAKLAKKLQLEQGRPFKVSTANGIVKAYRARLNRVAIGNIERFSDFVDKEELILNRVELGLQEFTRMVVPGSASCVSIQWHAPTRTRSRRAPSRDATRTVPVAASTDET